LIEESPNQRLLILWDGASYHRSKEFKDFLDEVNQGLLPEQWKVTCVRFAPNCPIQNPIEDIWLQAKTWVRRFCALIPSFSHLKWMFERSRRRSASGGLFDTLPLIFLLFRCTVLFQKSNISPIYRMSQGELASKIAVETVLEEPIPTNLKTVEQRHEWLISLVQKANGSVANQVKDGGTTLSVIFAVAQQLMIAHVGDSRIYLLRQAEIRFL
jgi:transposase